MCTQCVCVSIYLVKVYWTIFPLLCLAVVFPCQSVNLSWVSQRLTFNIGNIFGLKENYCDPLLRHWGWCREWYIYLKGQACLRPMQDFVPDLQFGWLVGWSPKFPAYNAAHHFSCFPLNGYKPTCSVLCSQIHHHHLSLAVIQEKQQIPLTLNSWWILIIVFSSGTLYRWPTTGTLWWPIGFGGSNRLCHSTRRHTQPLI